MTEGSQVILFKGLDLDVQVSHSIGELMLVSDHYIHTYIVWLTVWFWVLKWRRCAQLHASYPHPPKVFIAWSTVVGLQVNWREGHFSTSGDSLSKLINASPQSLKESLRQHYTSHILFSLTPFVKLLLLTWLTVCLLRFQHKSIGSPSCFMTGIQKGGGLERHWQLSFETI